MSNSLWPHVLQHFRLPYPSLCLRICSKSCPLLWWCHPTILIHCCFCCSLLLLHSIFSSIRVFSNELTLHIRWQVLELQLHHQCLQWISRLGFLKDWLASSPCTPKDSQESATPQFKTISSLALSLLYSPALILYMTTGKIIALIIQTFVVDVSAF